MSLEDVLIETNKQLAALTAAILQQTALISNQAVPLTTPVVFSNNTELGPIPTAAQIARAGAPADAVRATPPARGKTSSKPKTEAEQPPAPVMLDVQKALAKVISAYGGSREKAGEIVRQFGSPNISGLKPADYAAVIALAEKAIAEAPTDQETA